MQHGMDVNGNDKYDMEALGESEFAKSLGAKDIPQEATDPATCGEVTPTGGVETGGGVTEGGVDTGLLAAGAGALVLAGGLQVMRRRSVVAERH